MALVTTLRGAGFDPSSTVQELADAIGVEAEEVLARTGLRDVDTKLESILDEPFDFPEDFDVDGQITAKDVDGVRGQSDFSLSSGRTSTGAAHMMRLSMGAFDVVRPRDLIETPADAWRAKLGGGGDIAAQIEADAARDEAMATRAEKGLLPGVPKGPSPHSALLKQSAAEKRQLLS